MELDELKYQLKDKLATDHAGRSDADIAALINKKTISVTGKLKKSLWFEIYSCIAVILCFSYIAVVAKQHYLRIYFTTFTLLFIVFLLIIIYLLQRIKKLSGTILPVKSNLQTIVNIIEEFSRRYFEFMMALIPVCFIFAFWLGYTEKHPVAELDGLVKHATSPWILLLLSLLYMLLLAVGAYYLTRWYLNKLYGKYIVQLKACIEELKED